MPGLRRAPDRNDDGILWLLPGQPPDGLLPNPLEVCYPPICAPCCTQALRQCPALRPAHTLLRVERVAPAGVVGGQINDDGELMTDTPRWFRYGDPCLPMVIAEQQAIWLLGTHPVNGC